MDERTRQQIERRRTFAIISHPDAGKTTLTEKLLLYGGLGQGQAKRQARRFRLDGAGKAARYLGHLFGDAV